MEQFRSRGVGVIIAIIVLAVVVILAILGRIDFLTAGLFGALAIARLT